MSLCTLIPALVGLISGILGYLLGKMGSKGGDNRGSISLQSDLDACRDNSKSLSARIASLENDLVTSKSASSSTSKGFTSSAGETYSYNAAASLAVLGKKWKQDDLKIVEGIGPKIEGLYHNAGIKTWKSLSETSVEKSQSILDSAGERYAVHNPATWAKQAQLAYQGKWQELKDWQDSLDGGKQKT